jgi:uncharacterized membrane protein
MSTYRARIEIDVPVRTAYDQWTQFEEFPRFMEGVEEVRQIDDAYTEWHAEIGGQQRTWVTRITDQEPDRIIAWTSVEGDLKTGGTVTFEPLGDGRSAVELRIDLDADDATLERRVSGDLERFKTFLEERGEATGAWRGEIPADHPLQSEGRSA